ncbi:hypothetical protein ACHAW5_006995 [Stephanodiscus triporus]|uniref:Uncharacterized protein n=1 Tax=Stephanodiscus triporus TaxID=2934178 RepID=A0ABD3Q7A3_9STRA
MKSYSHTALLLSACVASLIIRDASSFFAPLAATATSRLSSCRIIVAPLSMAGFGGSGSRSSSSSSKGGGAGATKLPRLKAKSQWDRYSDLRQCKKVTVGVRIDPPAVGGEEDDDDGEGRKDGAVWVAVDKSRGDDVPDGIERRIGFEGIPDKATGYYCYYNGGRIVERGETGGEKTSLRSQRTASKSDAGTKPGGASRGS